MRKQYRYTVEDTTYQHILYLFHDGKLIEKKVITDNKQLPNEIKRLEADGYTRGYTLKTVECVRKYYEEVRTNLIER